MKPEEINKDTKIKELSQSYPWLIDEVKKLSDRAAKLPSPMIKMILAKADMGDIASKVGVPVDELISQLKKLIEKHDQENA